MNYHSYTASELAADPYFVQWIKHPDTQSQKFWSDWLIQHPGKRKTVEEARHQVLLMKFSWDPATNERVEALWQKISTTNRTSREAADLGHSTSVGQTRNLWQSWMKVAASVAAVALLSALLIFTLKPLEVGEIVKHQRSSEAGEMVRYETIGGEIKEIILPDGSEVVLNANSTLMLPRQWEQEREVWLSGEAFFTVKKFPVRIEGKERMVKFTVHTSSLQVQVLGTEFNVSDRDQKAVVVLNSGSIQLQLPSDSTIMMVPGELASFENGKQKIVKKAVKPEVYSSWKNSEWILDNLTLEELASKIETRYSVQVEIRNKKEGKGSVSGVVPTENLDILLAALATTLEVEVTRKDNKVIIE